MTNNMLAWFGYREIILILVVVLLLFGGKKLPELARSLGRGMREFKNEFSKSGSEQGNPPPTEDTPPDEESTS